VSEIRSASREGTGRGASPVMAAPTAWAIRPARANDAERVAAAVRELLLELDGTPGELSEMTAAARALIVDPAAGAVLVAEAGDELVGVLGASWQAAIHVPGAYALIQDLWVRADWRGRAVGRDLLEELCRLAGARGFARVEVGLPRESFARFAATEAFYLGNGFTANGPRMRRLLA
jgi:GNAT superfamily N-acetyltransferase